MLNLISSPCRRLLTGVAALALVVGAGSPAAAGRVPGPGTDTNFVNRGSERTYHITFRGGELAQVTADGDGDIDLFVYDSAGRLVDFDDELDSIPVVSWYPRSTQTFRVVVKNADTYRVDYTLETN